MNHNIYFSTASFKNFENIPGLDAFERAEVFQMFTDYMVQHGQMNFRFSAELSSMPPRDLMG